MIACFAVLCPALAEANLAASALPSRASAPTLTPAINTTLIPAINTTSPCPLPSSSPYSTPSPPTMPATVPASANPTGGFSLTSIKEGVHDRLSHTNIKEGVHDRLSRTEGVHETALSHATSRRGSMRQLSRTPHQGGGP